MIIRSCQICQDLLMDSEEHTEEACRYWQSQNFSLRAMLALCIRQAVYHALTDSIELPDLDKDGWRFPTADEKAELVNHPARIPRSALGRMDPEALASNVVVRLLGPGGWYVHGLYAGNATDREVFEASFPEPDRDHAAEVMTDVLDTLKDLGLEVDRVTFDPRDIIDGD